MKRSHVHDRGSLRRGDRAEDAGGAFKQLRAPLRDLVRPLGVCSQTPAGNRRTSNCSANSASVLSPLMAASATFALNTGLWFRRGRLVMVLSSLSAIMPIMRGSSTHRPCPDFPSHLSRSSARGAVWFSPLSSEPPVCRLRRPQLSARHAHCQRSDGQISAERQPKAPLPRERLRPRVQCRHGIDTYQC